MSADFARPRLCVSKCLGFAACRWNGAAIQDDFVKSLKNYVDFVTVCPEVEIGLGVPRDPIRIVGKPESLRLVQPATGRDVSGKMKAFAKKFLMSLDKVDGFIMKDRSPSCGLGNVKVYPSAKSSASVAKTHGFFGAEAVERFAGLPIETEASLTNCRIRERFLARIFTLAGFRQIKKSKKMRVFILALVFCLALSAYAFAAETRVGTASWYRGLVIAGNKFYVNGHYAAMWGVPLGTKVRITNLENGRAIIVTINDRGPSKRLAAKGRIIDLAAKAFYDLTGGFKSGPIKIKVEILGGGK